MSEFSMVYFTVIAAAIYVTLPMFVGFTIDSFHFSERQAGFFAAADMFGACLSSLIISFTIHRLSWRKVLGFATICLVLADILSGLFTSFSLLTACRICAGLCEGALLSLANAGIGELRNSDRVFGFSNAAQIAFGALALVMAPSVVNSYGVPSVFFAYAVLSASGLAFVRHMPCGPCGPREAQSLPASGPGWISAPSLMGLAAVLLFFVAQGGVWAFLDRIGIAHHLPDDFVSKVLALSSVSGFTGASLASALSTRYGRLHPLFLGAIGSITSMLVLGLSKGGWLFAAMASLFNFAWNLCVPYQFGLLSAVDPSRRTVVLGGVVVFAGLTIGPAVAGVLMQRGSSVAFTGAAAILSAASLCILVPVARRTTVTR
jgi:predicted MFS family arabinose efflux permease